MIHWWWLIPAFVGGAVFAFAFTHWISSQWIPPNWR